jgi:hypothetical protein
MYQSVCLGLYKAYAHCDCCEAMHACMGDHLISGLIDFQMQHLQQWLDRLVSKHAVSCLCGSLFS